MEAVIGWILRGILIVTGVVAASRLVAALVAARHETEERWPFRIALGMVGLVLLYAWGHARMLADRERIEAGRTAYLRFGDPRQAELRRAEVRGWILDCTGEPENALAAYGVEDGVVERIHPLGAAGENFIGGGEQADQRDYTVERLYAAELRRPMSLEELGELHPAGTDLSLTLCRGATERAWELLRGTRRDGAVIVMDVHTGALVAYASTGGPDDPPLGLQSYAAPGSVWKLALAAVWWENGVPDRPMSCESPLVVSERSTIRNSEGFSIPTVSAPAEMLVFSCNTTAVQMALELRDRLGERTFADAYRRFGVEPYAPGEAPGGFDTDFWRASSAAWRRRMSPPPARVRLSTETIRDEWAQLAIGQGPIDVTPIHLARFVSAIGNDGIMVDPTIEARLAQEEARGREVMSPQTAGRLLGAMRRVVDHGTARSTAPVLEGLDWDLAGKTGTAQVAGAADNGWFAGLILDPSSTPRYGVVVFLKGGGPGGRLPAGVAAGMTRYFATEGAQ